MVVALSIGMDFQFVVMFIDSFMDDVTLGRNVEVCMYVEYDLLHARVHLLWL